MKETVICGRDTHAQHTQGAVMTERALKAWMRDTIASMVEHPIEEDLYRKLAKRWEISTLHSGYLCRVARRLAKRLSTF